MKIKNLIFLLCIYFSPTAFSLPKVITIDIIYVGSDELTKSLERELRTQISHSREFAMSSDKRSEMQLLMVEDVKLKKIANHNQVSYKVNFNTQQKLVGVSTGSCWEEQIFECADKILRDAKIFIHR
ncbi:MAG: hypothetical protein EOO52_05825 [Gammaproteobacteria bacterium]|nr:MAG: hypothetical protein EOO52_05825 [Gammaproteobacteria bacterium]